MSLTRSEQRTDMIYLCPDGTVFVSPDGTGRIYYQSVAEVMDEYGEDEFGKIHVLPEMPEPY